jgi:hypothetical protein
MNSKVIFFKNVIRGKFQNFLKTFINQYTNYNKIRWEVGKDAQLNLKERQKVLKVDAQNVRL